MSEREMITESELNRWYGGSDVIDVDDKDIVISSIDCGAISSPLSGASGRSPSSPPLPVSVDVPTLSSPVCSG